MATSSVQEIRKCDLGGSARCKKINSSALEEHGRQNERMKAWLQGSQKDADICACQSFFMAAVIVDIYFSSLQWNSVC